MTGIEHASYVAFCRELRLERELSARPGVTRPVALPLLWNRGDEAKGSNSLRCF